MAAGEVAQAPKTSARNSRCPFNPPITHAAEKNAGIAINPASARVRADGTWFFNTWTAEELAVSFVASGRITQSAQLEMVRPRMTC